MKAAKEDAQVYLFIAPGFEEDFVVRGVVHLRKVGIGVALVGITRGEMVGAHRVGVCPDLSLDELGDGGASQIIFIPGGGQCTRALTVDPRFHQVVKTAVEGEGMLVLAREAQKILQHGWLPLPASKVLVQEDMAEGDFFDLLVRLVSVGEFLKKRVSQSPHRGEKD